MDFFQARTQKMPPPENPICTASCSDGLVVSILKSYLEEVDDAVMLRHGHFFSNCETPFLAPAYAATLQCSAATFDLWKHFLLVGALPPLLSAEEIHAARLFASRYCMLEFAKALTTAAPVKTDILSLSMWDPRFNATVLRLQRVGFSLYSKDTTHAFYWRQRKVAA